MPFQIHGAITHYERDAQGGMTGKTTSYDRGDLVPDSLGAMLHEEHPGLVIRVEHDDDLCAKDCAHEVHAWNAPALQAKAKPVIAPQAETSKGE